jgi:hypothetical protein
MKPDGRWVYAVNSYYYQPGADIEISSWGTQIMGLLNGLVTCMQAESPECLQDKCLTTNKNE